MQSLLNFNPVVSQNIGISRFNKSHAFRKAYGEKFLTRNIYEDESLDPRTEKGRQRNELPARKTERFGGLSEELENRRMISRTTSRTSINGTNDDEFENNPRQESLKTIRDLGQKGPFSMADAGWATMASFFLIGIGAGVLVTSVINVEPKNVASREVIDEKTPNPSVCMAYGMSAMVLDQRLFITFNPFNVYVSQAEVKPGCVLRRSNWQVLESRELVNDDEVRDCKRNMNTFGFVGDLRESPEVSCVYHSERAENQFLKDPKKAILGDGYTPRTNTVDK